jgi:hypothetical protein
MNEFETPPTPKQPLPEIAPPVTNDDYIDPSEQPIQLDVEVMRNYIDKTFNETAAESGFSFISTDDALRGKTQFDIVERMIERDIYDDTIDTAIVIEDTVALIDEADRMYIKKMKTLNTELRIASLLGEIGEEDMYAAKARLHVRMMCDQRVQPGAPIIDLLNITLPGQKIQDDDPKLEPYFQELLEERIEAEATSKKQLTEALGYSGITTESAGPLFEFISSMIKEMLDTISDIHSHTDTLGTDIEREKYVRGHLNYEIFTSQQVDLLVHFVNLRY